jgi:hypothetical protein
MTPTAVLTDADQIYFLNRDHVVAVTIGDKQIEVTTTVGTKIIIPRSDATLAKFVDELANDAESNFASIPLSPSAIAGHENAETESTET